MAGQFVQQASDVFIKGLPTSPAMTTGGSGKDERVSTLQQAETRQATAGTKEDQLNGFIVWLAKFPLEQNNPRATTGTIPIFKSNGVVCVHSHEKITDVFKKLVIEGFLSAPVLNKNNKYIGQIDMLDLVDYTVRLFGAIEKYERTARGWASFFEEERQWKDATARDVMRRRSMVPRAADASYPVLRGFSLFHPYEILARTGLRRIPVVDERSNIVGLVTQSMCISLLRQNQQRLAPILDLRVREMEAVLGPLISIRSDEKAIEGFRLMADKNISGLAVVDKEGVLVDTLSIRDLRGIGTDIERYHRLFYEVAFFKELLKSEYRRQTPAAPLFCTHDSTLRDVLKMMDDGNIHRVWVCTLDDKRRPIPTGVISQKDVMLVTLREAGV